MLYGSICARYLEEENSDRKESGSLQGWRRGAWEQLSNRCGVELGEGGTWGTGTDGWGRTLPGKMVVLGNVAVLDPTELYTHGGQNGLCVLTQFEKENRTDIFNFPLCPGTSKCSVQQGCTGVLCR